MAAVTPFSLEANLVEQLPAVPERETYSQTDAFVARSTSNQKGGTADGAFQRPKVGVDSSTQVRPMSKALLQGRTCYLGYLTD